MWANSADNFPQSHLHLLLICSQIEVPAYLLKFRLSLTPSSSSSSLSRSFTCCCPGCFSSPPLLLILYLAGHQGGGPSRFAWSFSMFLRFSCLCCWALGFWKAPGDSLGHNFINKIGSESVVNKHNNIHWNLTERFDFPSLSVPPEFNEAWFGSSGSSAADHVIVP